MNDRYVPRFHKGLPGSRRGWRLAHGVASGESSDGPPVKRALEQATLSEATLAGLEAGEPYCAYLAPEGFVKPMVEELTRPYFAETTPYAADSIEMVGRLVVVPGAPQKVAWAQETWPTVKLVEYESVRDAATKLAALNRNWANVELALPSRATLVTKALPHVSFKPLSFGALPKLPPLGGFALLDSNHLLACPACATPYPNGEMRLQEDHDGPPSRAYLKLWELFGRVGKQPLTGQRCVDLGASPGGWTWVLAKLGAEVVAVDKADLDPELRRLPNVSLRQESAFGVDPQSVGPVDWLFSDIICYPDRLLTLVERWMASGLVRNWVCSLKLQGETDHETIRKFARIPGSKILHLCVNRHELTWCRLAPDE